MPSTLFFWLLSLISTLSFGAHDYPLTVNGADESSFNLTLHGPLVEDRTSYDTVIVGGGLAGLASAVFLTDHGQHVLLLEKEPHLGGLAAGESIGAGARVGRGAAYWTSAYEEELKILERIGLGDFDKKFAIPEPIDSYFWNGQLYEGLWEDETLEKLPASFALFKHELKLSEKHIPNQPMEEATDLEFDKYSAAQLIRRMPSLVARRRDEKSREIYHRFLKDSRLDRRDPMRDVVELLDLYCRSALGATTDKVSAVAFANFYLSELETRYTTDEGTGRAADKMVEILKKVPKAVLSTNTPVIHIRNAANGVEVDYLKDGQGHRVKAKFLVFAAQLKMAPRLIEGFTVQAPVQAKLMSQLPYAHYSVHVVSVKGHPYRATYDTWTRAKDYTEADFTDVILGRWMDPEIKAYEGYRDFKRDPSDERGVMSIYHPLEPKWVGQAYDKAQAEKLAETAISRMIELYGPMLKEKWGTSIQVTKAETNRWPYSVHVARPGHFSKDAKILRKPFGRVYFANNNLGTPAFEEALFRGHCAANNILLRVERGFKQEAWSRCPVDSLR